METAHATWRPLGELIVERGLITQEQLEDALLEQRITRKRLGTILVDKGIVSAQELTDSLVDQIGVEDLLDEFDRTETEAGEHRSARRFGAPLRRVRERLHGVELPSPARLATPFVRLGARTAELGRRGRNGGSQPDAPITSTPPFETEEYVSETTVVEIVELETVELGTVDLAATQIEAPEAAEPHAWLAVARGALEEAEADLSRLDDAVFAQSHELADVRKELAGRESELAQESSAHRRAEEEVGRLHALIDERDTGLTAMEATVEELREQRTAVQSELADLRLDFEGSSRALERTQQDLSERTARIAQLEAAMKDHEQRGHRITELEAQAADLAENLSATDETLGIEMHAREQAQREAKRLQDELDDRNARIAKLARQVEALEAELQVIVAEREQAQRKLRSRERRVTKLESTLAELRADESAVDTQPPSPVEPESHEPEVPAAADEESSETETITTEAEAETTPEAEPVVAAVEQEPAAQVAQAEGFLYFVPRPGEGYELVEHDGVAPELGGEIELEGQSFEATRHGRSPLPFDRRICVYLRATE